MKISTLILRRLMIFNFVFLMVFAAVVPIRADDIECIPITTSIESWFDVLATQIKDYEKPILVSDPIWGSVADIFSDLVLITTNGCADKDVDYGYSGQVEIKHPDLLFGYAIQTSITPIDVDLDDSNEWLITFHVGDFQHGQRFMYVLYQSDNIWEVKDVWDQDTIDESLTEVSPTGVYVHNTPDVQGYTYMGIGFSSMKGLNPYIGGLRVLRWKDWKYEEVITIPEICVGEWATNDEGMLYISVTSSVPHQGCTVVSLSPDKGIVIPDAQMIEETED